MDISEEQYCCNSETDDEYESDESQEDPTFDAMEETRLNLSSLSVDRKTKIRAVNGADKRNEQETNGADVTDEQDFKSYDTIQTIILGGNVETLKVDQCKVYLRKHGLRLSGNKDTLIWRIKEHIHILSAGAEEKYPASSFVLNCKGDACTGDVVMFEQNVYEMFNIASRSANGPPCGTRVIAGRIVKESYGAAKQQHTFTIEVLWSRGEKPFPPLHPLLIKGRNLYRLKTMRQKWEDEGEREKILAEKHSRGGIARVNREARVQKKQMRMMPMQKRGRRDEDPLRPKPAEKGKTLCPVSTRPEKLVNQPKQKQQDCGQKACCQIVADASDIPNHSGNFIENPKSILGDCVPAELLYQRQPLMSVNGSSFPRGLLTISTSNFTKSNNLRTPVEMMASRENNGFNSVRSPMRGFGNYNVRGQYDMNLNGSMYSFRCTGYRGQENYIADCNASIQEAGYGRKQTCRYYPQGMCHFGDRCRFLHE